MNLFHPEKITVWHGFICPMDGKESTVLSIEVKDAKLLKSMRFMKFQNIQYVSEPAIIIHFACGCETVCSDNFTYVRVMNSLQKRKGWVFYPDYKIWRWSVLSLAKANP